MGQSIKIMDIIMAKLQVLLKTMVNSICNTNNSLCSLKSIRMIMIKYMKRTKKTKIMNSLLKSKCKNSFKCSKEDKWSKKMISRILIRNNSTIKKNKMKMVSYKKKRSTKENMKEKEKEKNLTGKVKKKQNCRDRVKSIWKVMTKVKMMKKIMKNNIKMERRKRKENWMKKNTISYWLNSNNNSK